MKTNPLLTKSQDKVDSYIKLVPSHMHYKLKLANIDIPSVSLKKNENLMKRSKQFNADSSYKHFCKFFQGTSKWQMGICAVIMHFN